MMAMGKTGLISTIQRYSTKDGPGIRSTVFCQGCNLRCVWCANPELLASRPAYLYFKERCIHCGGCVRTAANQAIVLTPEGCVIDRDRCTNLEECGEFCPTGAFESVGYRISSADLAAKLQRDVLFYQKSGGGVTFSGGEPARQGDFIAETAGLLRTAGIHTALDTAGALPWAALQSVLQAIDLVLYDLKTYDAALHQTCTGVDNGQILANARHIAQMEKAMIIRLVLVPGWNDQLADIAARLEFVKALGSAVRRVELLPYHNLGEGKYARLGLPYPLQGRIAPWPEELLPAILRLGEELNLPLYLSEA